MSDGDIPAVRYLTAYTPDNPPPPFKTWWVRPNGPDLEILGQHVDPPDDLISLGTHVVGSACAHEGTCSDHDRKLLGAHGVLCRQCDRVLDDGPDICEDCAWDIHSQLDGWTPDD